MRSFVIGVAFIAIFSGTGYASPLLWSGNGHYYDFVHESRTWSGALARAGQLTFDPDGSGDLSSMTGYLVTITSALHDTADRQSRTGVARASLDWSRGAGAASAATSVVDVACRTWLPAFGMHVAAGVCSAATRFFFIVRRRDDFVDLDVDLV
jgi:hypothetical protein